MKPIGHNSLSGATEIPAAKNPKELRRGGAWGNLSGSNAYRASSDATLFSSSLPVFPHSKLNSNDREGRYSSAEVDVSTEIEKLCLNVNGDASIEDRGFHGIGNLLPDDEDELLAGIADDFDLSGLPGSLDDVEEYDVFDSGGGMELETDAPENHRMSMSNVNLIDASAGNGLPHYALTNGVGSVAGEHPYGEHPSRTLFVRNINSNVEDLELKALFEQYGDIRSLYTACKHRGFVMITYYDIRDARMAMRSLQNKPLRRRKLDIHFSIPKDNPSDKDVNQGTLVVFNLDPSVSNEDLRVIFGAYGEVKEIRETPQKKHHKFVEYYDARAAEAALKSLNRSEIAGKRIKLEPSRPGGARRSLMVHLNQDPEQDDSWNFRNSVGSPLAISPPGNWMKFNSSIEHNPMHNISKSPGLTAKSPTTSSHSPGLAALLHPQLSNAVKVSPIGKEQGRGSLMDHVLNSGNSTHGSPGQQSHSFPELKLNHFNGSSIPSFGSFTSNGSRMETLSGPQFLWGSPKPHAENGSSAWPRTAVGHQFTSTVKGQPLSLSGHHGSFIGSSHHHYHHVGSAPTGVPLKRHFGFFPESPETSFLNPAVYGNMGLGRGDGKLVANMGSRPAISPGIPLSGSMSSDNSSNFNIMSSSRLSPVFLGNGFFPGLQPRSIDGLAEQGRMRRVENNGNLIDSKKQFQLDLEKIISGEDTRTTLMIKNIPNKYTSKMLLAAIDENHRGTYDFLYLPIDFKNKCNVGYAFINMISPSHIIPFYEAFNGKKWEKFNSEKVALLAYARIQGKAALVTHFQNSSLMNEDKRCRPILFYSEGSEACDEVIQEHFSPNSLNIQVSQSGGFSSSPTNHNSHEVPEKS